MTPAPRLDGAVPVEPGSRQDIALAALTRRVAEVEHRLDVMKIIVGLVLTGKVVIVALLVYVVFGSIPVRGRAPISQPVAAVQGVR